MPQSAGLVESLGSMSKSIGVGNAAKNGLAAALFAEAGFTGAERAIEGRYGFAPVTSDSLDLSKITEGLGSSWEILANSYKPYPCGVVLFPVIDACLELVTQRRPAHEDIAEIVVRGHPLLGERTDRPDVETGREAKVSLQHTVAAALLYGGAGLREYQDNRVAAPAVRYLRAKVRFEQDDNLPIEAAVVKVRFADGSEVEQRVRDGRGTPGRPMSDDELDAKVRELQRLALLLSMWTVLSRQSGPSKTRRMPRA
jgi:2-methylcitrate dehydratase PrpD